MEGRVGLLVSSTGGHLEQLVRLSAGFTPAFDRIEFATFDDPQSRSLLAGQVVHHVEHIPSRGLREAFRAAGSARDIIRAGGYTDVISTGAAIAVPFLVNARRAGVRTHYVESAARSRGPSLTGRIVQRIPGINLYCQYRSWSDDRWRYSGSIFDGVSATPRVDAPTRARRIVVTLGTIRYPFRRAVEAVQRILPDIAEPDAEILWQLADTIKFGPGPLP